MTTQQMIDAIRKGDRLGHKAMQQIADRLESMDRALMAVAEGPNTYSPNGRVPQRTKAELFRLGAPLHDILAGADDNDDGGDAA